MPVYPLQVDTTTGAMVAAPLASGMVGSGGITSGSLADGAVLSANIASGHIGVGHFQSGAIQSGKLGNAAIVSGNIASGQIGFLHVAALGIGSGNLANGAVLSANIASGQVGEAHIASGVIVAADLASGAVLSGNIGNAAVVSGSIASGQIGFLHVAALGIGSGNLGNGAVLSANVASGQIAFLHIAALGVGSGNLANAAVLSANIASGQVGVNHLQSGAVRSGGLGNAAVVSGNLASGHIAFFHIAALGIGSGNLDNGAVLSANVASGQVGGMHLAGVISAVAVMTLHQGATNSIQAPAGTILTIGRTSGNAFHTILVRSGIGGLNIENDVGAEGAGLIFNNPRDVAYIRLHGVTSTYGFGSGGAWTTSGYWALSSFIGSGQIGNNHVAAGAVGSNSIASGAIGGRLWNPTTAIAGIRLSGDIVIVHEVANIVGIWGTSAYLQVTPTSGIGEGAAIELRGGGRGSGSVDVVFGGNVHLTPAGAFTVLRRTSGQSVIAARVTASGIIEGVAQVVVSGGNSGGGLVAIGASGNIAPVVISGHHFLFGRADPTPTPGFFGMRANADQNNIAMVSGGAADVAVIADEAPNFRVAIAPPQPAGSGFTFVNVLVVGSGGTRATSGYWALSSFIGSGQIGGNHLAAGAVGTGHVASGALFAPHTVSGGPLVVANQSGGIVAIGLSGNITAIAISGHHFLFGRADPAPSPGFFVMRANADHRDIVQVSGGAIDAAVVADGAPLFRVAIALPAPAGSSVTFVNAFVVGSGGTIATSGYWALSSFIGSGQVGGTHLAAAAVLSANIGSGRVGGLHINPSIVSGTYDWGTIAFFNPASGFVAIPPGLSGQKLTTVGSGFDPVWAV